MVSAAVEKTQAVLKDQLPGLLLEVNDAAGEATAKRLVKRLRVAWYDPKTGTDDHGRGPRENDRRSPKDAQKVSAAKASHKPSTAEKQRWAEGNEKTVASMTGGQGTDDNSPADVTTTINGKKHGVEVKTMVDNANNKITMHPSSRERKEKWGRQHNATMHTVVLDDRKAFGTKGYSGHRIYYKRGVGSFRLKNMTKVKSSNHLRQLMTE